MSSTVSRAETKYPIFAAKFAHNDPSILIVGGGGGAGRSGVKNCITAFDFRHREATVAEPIAEIELSRDEDSVTSLDTLATKDGVIAIAGINSSEEDRIKGKNEPFRAFEVQFPRKKTGSAASKDTQGKISLLSKTNIFKPFTGDPAKKEGYQRIVRFSPPKAGVSGSKRIGAAATSLADNENQLVLFNATSTKPQLPGDIILEEKLQKKDEANDVDIIEPEDGTFKVAYVTDYALHVADFNYDFGKKKVNGKAAFTTKYEIPYPDVARTKGRPKLRNVRWLSPTHLLVLENKHNRSGSELCIIRLYEHSAAITLRKLLPRHVKAAVDLDAVWLDSDEKGDYQIACAVAGIDQSVSVYTLDYYGRSGTLSYFNAHATFRDVHPVSLTKVVFSPYSASSGKVKTPSPQYLRLASTSLGNSISVDTFTLQPVSATAGNRHVLSSARSRRLQSFATYFAGAFVILVIAILAQSYLFPEANGIQGLVPENVRNIAGQLKPPGARMEEARAAARNAVPEGAKVPVARTTQRIRDILHIHRHESHEEPQQKAVVIHHDPEVGSSLSTEVHDDHEDVVKRHTEAKKWEELSHAERSRWKEKLVSAGMWAVDEGETILKGIFFSEAGGLVGHIVQGAMHR